jgi:hypothetical protein
MYNLVEAMNFAVALMHEAEPLQHDHRRRQIAKLIARQVIECGHFISKYARTPAFCKYNIQQQGCVKLVNSGCLASRLLKNIANNTTEDIKCYQDRLTDLISNFKDSSTIETNIIVLKILKTTDSLGMFFQPMKIFLVLSCCRS